MKLTIDGKSATAREGQSVLQCALEHGISIPHLCTHPQLPAFGACRMCVVQIEGMRGFPTSCTTPAAEGMVVQTDTAELRDLRRRILELMMLEHPSACLLCDKQELCERYRPKATKAGRTTGCHTCNNKEVCEVRVLSAELGLKRLPVAPTYRQLELERSDPFIDRDLNLCILCGRCVRICKAHQGWGVIDFVGRGSETRIGEAFGRSLGAAGCRFCGSCVDVCPTGSLADRFAKWYGGAATTVETTCSLCDAACAVRVGTSSQRRTVSARGIDERWPICVLGRFGHAELLAARDRLTVPKARVGSVLREIAWDAAIAQAGERLRAYQGGACAVICDTGSTTLEDRHLLGRLARDVLKTPHFIELTPTASAAPRAALPAGVKAALVLGDLLDTEAAAKLELLIVQDFLPSALLEHAHFVFPAAVLSETAGTTVDASGARRPLRQAAQAPGKARPDWQIACELARACGASGFDHAAVDAVSAKLGGGAGELLAKREAAPAAALDAAKRWGFFRGHALDARIRGLGDIPTATPERAAVAAGG